MHTFQINVLILILDVFYTFRTSCVHHQEDHLLRIKHILPPARLLTEMHGKLPTKMHVQMVFLRMNTRCSRHVEDTKNLN
jgi:hypothetical protein